MKQAIRLFLYPRIFFNQLQWSKNHVAILFSFLVITLIETQVSKDLMLYAGLVSPLVTQWHLSEDSAIWAITALRTALMVASFISLVESLWFIGSLLGKEVSRSQQKNSKRVFYRRMAVVSTIFLAGHTAYSLLYVHTTFCVIGILLYLWSLRLGYFAMQEQFQLHFKQLLVLGVVSMVIFLNSVYMVRSALQYIIWNLIGSKLLPSSSITEQHDEPRQIDLT